jgi:hypothetical protein
MLFSKPTTFEITPVVPAGKALDTHPAVVAAAQKHAAASALVRSNFDKIEKRKARLASIRREHTDVADAVLAGDEDALRADERLSAEVASIEHEIAAILRAASSIGHARIRDAAEAYRRARGEAAAEIARELRARETVALAEATRRREAFDQVATHIAELRLTAEQTTSAHIVGNRAPATKFTGVPTEVVDRVLNPPPSESWPLTVLSHPTLISALQDEARGDRVAVHVVVSPEGDVAVRAETTRTAAELFEAAEDNQRLRDDAIRVNADRAAREAARR